MANHHDKWLMGGSYLNLTENEKMTYEIFDKNNLTFGIIWGLLAYFMGQFIIKIIEFIQTILDFLFKLGLNIFIFPSKVLDFIKFDNLVMKALLVVMVAILLAPFARKALEWFNSVSKKSTVWDN